MAELRRRFKGTRSDRDRHGNVRWYTLDPKTGRKIRMREEPGSDAWVAEWKAIRAGAHASQQTDQSRSQRAAPGSLAALIHAYKRSPEYAALKASTRAVRARILASIEDAGGDLKADGITSADIRAGRNARADTPAAANNRLKVLSALFSWGVEEGLVSRNPVFGVDRLKEKQDGARAWTAGECQAFEARHPSGSRARLIYALGLYTGARRSDLCRLGPQHLTPDGFLRIEQVKTGRLILVPVMPALAAELAQASKGFAFIQTQAGKAFTANGLGNVFRDACDAAGLQGLSLHGLRKTLASRLAEDGVSAHGIAAVTGHVTLSEVQRYTRDADQKRLALEAMSRAFGEQNVPPNPPTFGPVGTFNKKAL